MLLFLLGLLGFFKGSNLKKIRVKIFASRSITELTTSSIIRLCSEASAHTEWMFKPLADVAHNQSIHRFLSQESHSCSVPWSVGKLMWISPSRFIFLCGRVSTFSSQQLCIMKVKFNDHFLPNMLWHYLSNRWQKRGGIMYSKSEIFIFQ